MIPPYKDNGVTPELRATRTADPAKELQKAIHKRNIYFLGVNGYTMMVPGIPGEATNPLVFIVGAHSIAGTSDYLLSTEQERLQAFAYRYAERYNALLFAHLLRVNHPSIGQARRKIDEEIMRMERRDPIRDAQEEIGATPLPMFIELSSSFVVMRGKENMPGIDPAARKAVLQDDFYPSMAVTLIPEMMAPSQRQRFDRMVAHYIVPYNLCILAYYKEWRRTHRHLPTPVLPIPK